VGGNRGDFLRLLDNASKVVELVGHIGIVFKECSNVGAQGEGRVMGVHVG